MTAGPRALASVIALTGLVACGGGDVAASSRTEAPGLRLTGGRRSPNDGARAFATGESGAIESRSVGRLEVRATPPDQPPARVTRFEGDVSRLRGTTLTPGEGLDFGDGLVVHGQGCADIDLGNGRRISLERETEIRVAERGTAQILLLRGSIHALVPPGPNGLRAPLRVATPAASIELGGSGEFYAVAHPSGATWVVGLAGVTTVASGEIDARRRLRTIELPAGSALLVGSRGMGEPTEGPTRLEDARTASVTLFETAAALDTDRMLRELEEGARRLDESLLWLEAELRRGRELSTQHRGAVRAGRSQEAMRLERELVAHGQKLYVLRELVTARWERLLVGSLQFARLAGVTPASATEWVETRRDRVESLIGR